MSVVFGIDPGSLALGFACIEKLDVSPSQYRLIDSGVLTPKASWPLYRRLGFLYKHLSLKIAELSPQILCLEKAFYGLNVKTALILGSVRGAVMCLADHFSMLLEEYAPAEVKRAVVGYGRARKDQLRYMASQLLIGDWKTLKSDESDAACIALCHFLRSHSHYTKSVFRNQKDEIMKIGSAKVIRR